MPSYLIGSEIKGKITGPRNIGQSDLIFFVGHFDLYFSVKLNKYPKYDAYLLDRARDIRHNQWVMEYKS